MYRDRLSQPSSPSTVFLSLLPNCSLSVGDGDDNTDAPCRVLILRTVISPELLLTDADFLKGLRRIVSLGAEQMVGVWASSLCFYLYMR